MNINTSRDLCKYPTIRMQSFPHPKKPKGRSVVSFSTHPLSAHLYL